LHSKNPFLNIVPDFTYVACRKVGIIGSVILVLAEAIDVAWSGVITSASCSKQRIMVWIV